MVVRRRAFMHYKKAVRNREADVMLLRGRYPRNTGEGRCAAPRVPALLRAVVQHGADVRLPRGGVTGCARATPRRSPCSTSSARGRRPRDCLRTSCCRPGSCSSRRRSRGSARNGPRCSCPSLRTRSPRFAVATPSRNLFDAIVRGVLQDAQGRLARMSSTYDPALTPEENLPGGKMSEGQRQFVENVWHPILKPQLVARGFLADRDRRVASRRFREAVERLGVLDQDAPARGFVRRPHRQQVEQHRVVGLAALGRVRGAASRFPTPAAPAPP